jgi:hypothetical protein
MARQLTRAALNEIYKNPIIIPDLPEYETAETIIDTAVRADIFETWLRQDVAIDIPIPTTPTMSLSRVLKWLWNLIA